MWKKSGVFRVIREGFYGCVESVGWVGGISRYFWEGCGVYGSLEI